MNNPKYFVKDVDKHRTLVVDKRTGKETVVIKDQKYREMEKRGDFVQPDNPRFFDLNPDMKKNEKGEIVNTKLKYEKEREHEESFLKLKEEEDFKNRQQNYDKKWY